MCVLFNLELPTEYSLILLSLILLFILIGIGSILSFISIFWTLLSSILEISSKLFFGILLTDLLISVNSSSSSVEIISVFCFEELLINFSFNSSVDTEEELISVLLLLMLLLSLWELSCLDFDMLKDVRFFEMSLVVFEVLLVIEDDIEVSASNFSLIKLILLCKLSLSLLSLFNL